MPEHYCGDQGSENSVRAKSDRAGQEHCRVVNTQPPDMVRGVRRNR